MHYSRAGLVALIFALIVSLVSAAPILPTESKLSSTLSPPSNPIPNGQDHIQLDTTAETSGISLSGRMSTLPLATRLTRRQQIPTNLDDQLLVRRDNIFSKIKNAFQSVGNKIKDGFQKAGSAIKSGFQKFGNAVKTGVQKAGSAIKSGFQKFGNAVKTGVQKAGSAIKSGFQKAGGAIKSGLQKAGSAIKSGFQKVGNGIRTAATKTWDFMKTTGAKAAKFGLKVVQSVDQAASKVVGFIPGIGKPLGKAMEAESKIAGIISDHINVKLPDNLEKGMNIMEKADKIMDYIPRRREFSEEEVFQQRDIGETYHFEERDDIALENRDVSYFEANERDDIYERYDLDWE